VRSADRDVHVEIDDAVRVESRRLIRVDAEERAGLAAPPRDRGDVGECAGDVVRVRDDDEQRARVDRLENALGRNGAPVVGLHDARQRSEALPLLANVRHRRELQRLVDDFVALAAEVQARRERGEEQRDVRPERDAAGGRADDRADAVGDLGDARQPTLPRLRPLGAPFAPIRVERGARAERRGAHRVADEIRRVGEDRKLLAPERLRHRRLHP